MNILVLNAGSSTLKCAIFRLERTTKEPQKPLWKGSLDWGKGHEHALFHAENSHGVTEHFSFHLDSFLNAAEKLLSTAWSGHCAVLDSRKDIGAVGHRVVHGGQQFTQPTPITSKVKAVIKELGNLAPLHNPANLEGIEIAQKILPTIPQIAVFDTAYHATIDEVAASYPIPFSWRERGIRRYGFHGISHQYCAEKALEWMPDDHGPWKVVTCHLGNGCSLAASMDGRCVDTTMGFTPMEGVMMGARSGSVDPGALIYLLRSNICNLDEMDRALNEQSGLYSIGGSADMRVILQGMKEGDASAVLAFKMFVHSLKKHIAAMAASMDGMDLLVFTAGIGENAAEVRFETCRGLKHLGVELDDALNSPGKYTGKISSDQSSVKVIVIPTQEEWVIAKAAYGSGRSLFSRARSFFRF